MEQKKIIMKNEKKYPNYVGKKMRGFKHKSATNVTWIPEKSEYVGKVGEIIGQGNCAVGVQFEGCWCLYPIDMVEEHLVEEQPTLPKRGDEILVWDSSEWYAEKRIFVNYTEGAIFPVQVVWDGDEQDFKTKKPFKTISFKNWKPLPETPTYTHKELEEKIGEEFIYKIR